MSVRAGDNFLPRRRVGVIDPLHIECPFEPTKNIGRNCFRVVQIQKAFADASIALESKMMEQAELGVDLSQGTSLLTLIIDFKGVLCEV